MTATLDEPVTDAPAEAGGPPVEALRRTSSFRPEDAYAVVGALIAALSLTSLVYTMLAPLSGPIGFVIVNWVVFIAVYALLVSVGLPAPAIKDRLAAAVATSIALLLLTALAVVIFYVIGRGLPAMRHPNFYTHDMAGVGPLQGLDVGGIEAGEVGTLEQITLATLMTVPVGLTCAVFLSQTRGAFSRIVRTVVEAMTALPSIIAGLFIYAFYILTFHLPKSGFAAALALSIMMLPIIIRAADVVLRLVPDSLKEASLALGASQWRTVWQVTLPTARSGLATAVILGMARGIGETSPVLLTAGSTTFVNHNPFNGPQVSLPLLTLEMTRSPYKPYIARGFGAAATLMVIVLVLFIAARRIGGRGPGNLSPRQQARAAAASRRDVTRYEASPAVLPEAADHPDSHMDREATPE
jgi:phosphate transport system permease protein